MSENLHTPELLKEYQSYPLDVKVMMTETRIREFYTGYNSSKGYGNCYVSFSGGKDSTVLLDIARRLYPDIPACFSNTGLEYPEIQSFVRRHDNIDIVRPKMQFSEVISKYGYPLIGKEVAEAIYYARRIRLSSNTHTHTHTDGQTSGNVRQTDNLIQTSGARNRRTILQGKRGGEGTHGRQETGTQRQKSRGEWVDWRRGCL